ncbi:hypothetical protein G9A89_004222 [Geosiphon pyriformis]|nr:hypothetical protein G9A89_004222 [Geosiphon pyriformis]
MESKNASVNGMSDLENIDNMVAEETSYVDSNDSEANKMVNNMTPRKTQMRTYVLRQPPKKLSFNIMSDVDNVLKLPSFKFQGSNQLPSAKLHVLEKRSFEPVKSFALDIKLLAVSGKNVNEKLISIKKIFYQVDGFRRASTPLKFPGIIRSSFTSELSLNKAKRLVICEKILVNNDVRKLGIHSNQEIIVKLAVVLVFSKFGKVVSIKMQLIGLWQKTLVEFELLKSVLMGKDSVQVALAVKNKQSWVFRNQHRALLYTLPVGTTAHDLSGLIDSYSGKICFIGCNPSSYVHNRCAVVCFANKVSKLAAIDSNPVFKGVNLRWAGLFLACCAKCKQFGHISDACLSGEISGVCGKQVMTNQDRVHLAVPIACPVSFSGRIWAQVAGGSLVAEISLFAFVSSGDHNVYDHLAFLEHSLKLLADQVSGILEKLGSMKLVSLVITSDASLTAIPVFVVLDLDLNMVLDSVSAIFNPSSPVINDTAPIISPSSFKVLTTKVSGLESKMVDLEVLVESVLEKLDYLCSGLGSSAASISQ